MPFYRINPIGDYYYLEQLESYRKNGKPTHKRLGRRYRLPKKFETKAEVFETEKQLRKEYQDLTDSKSRLYQQIYEYYYDNYFNDYALKRIEGRKNKVVKQLRGIQIFKTTRCFEILE